MATQFDRITPATRQQQFAPAAGAVRQQSSLNQVLIVLFALRMISEGIDRYLGTPLSFVLTISLIVLSIYSVLASGRVPSRAVAALMTGIAFIVFAVVSFTLNLHHHIGLQFAYLVKLTFYVSVFIMAFTLRWGRSDLSLLLLLIVATTALEALVSIGQIATGTGFTAGDFGAVRALGLMSHPAILSVKMVALIIIVHTFRQFLSPLLYKIFMVSAAISLVLCYTRTGWLIFLIYLGVVAWKIRSPGLKALMLVIGLPLFIGLMFATGRFDDLTTIPQFISDGSYRTFNYERMNNTFEWRLIQWYDLAATAMQKPIFGHGPGVVWELNQFSRSSHNSLLDVFVEQGFVGLILFLLFLTAVVLTARGGLARRVEPPAIGNRYRTAWLSLSLGYLIAMTFGVSLFNQTLNMALFFLVMGIFANISARVHIQRQTENSASRRAMQVGGANARHLAQ